MVFTGVSMGFNGVFHAAKTMSSYTLGIIINIQVVYNYKPFPVSVGKNDIVLPTAKWCFKYGKS